MMVNAGYVTGFRITYETVRHSQGHLRGHMQVSCGGKTDSVQPCPDGWGPG